jgi:cellulose synthase/poly-beta-1,6-N-acetylglucosamine synthase-like glycosyltransferase
VGDGARKKMTPITISVAMCTFNGEEFLTAQLESIAAQDRLPEELVVCDDRSSDRTIEILRQFARRVLFPVRIEINRVNLGSTGNFEQCIALCRGTTVALADQDDVWYPGKLRRLEEAFQKADDIVAAFSDADVIDQESRPVGTHLWASLGLHKDNQKKFTGGRALQVLCNHPVVTGATLAFRRDLFDAMRPIPPKQFHDAWIVFLLAARGRFELIPEPLMQYRHHGRQQVGPGPNSMRLSQQIAEMMKRNKGQRPEPSETFQQLHKVLSERAETFPHARVAMKEIEGKLAHLARRAHLSRLGPARIFGVVHETATGAYWRYSSGWKSAAKDLLLP